MTRLRLPLLAILLSTTGLFAATEPVSPELRLRENLRATTLQLRTAQSDLATAQAAAADLATEKKSLGAELDQLKKQLVADRGESDKGIAALRAAAATQAADLAATRAELEKTRAALAKVIAYARKTETERNELAARVATLETQTEDQIARNIALFKLGNEILDSYAKFGLGQAIIAREPFIGTSRVKLENLVQDYDDRLRAQRINKAPAVTRAESVEAAAAP